MLKRFISILLILNSAHTIISSQKEGDKWVIGYYSLGDPEYSIMHLDFQGSSVKIEWHFNETMHMRETAANICDSNGDAILWTNGMQIFGKHGITIADTIASDGDILGYWNYYYSSIYGPFGFPQHDGAIILPIPENENEFSVIYHFAESHPTLGFAVSKYLEARVKMDTDSSFILMYKDSLIEPYHQWYSAPVIATRHANGRDWWITNFESDGPKYFSHLLDPTGLRFDHEGNVSMVIKEGLGQAAFSSQGNYMARVDATTFEEGQFITLFSFDRCRGDFELLETFHTEAGYFTGAAFSPSERYLYADDNKNLWQWDLWANDIAASLSLVDTFDGFVQPGWFEMQFGPLIAAPDGRIYIVPPAGSSNFIHVIKRPDLPAAECKFLQHSIDLTVPNGRSAPNLPNFRLGPLDGSPCDTLGLDNHPIARWRYEEDQPGIWQTLRFTDLSFYNPLEWHWDFDDGTISDEVSPVHTFVPGLYNVCLTISNTYDTDSACQWIEILTTSNEDVRRDVPDLSISPNPFSEALVIQSLNGHIRQTRLQLYDMHGQLVLDQPNAPVPVSIFLPSLPPGIYLCRIEERDGTLYNFKVLKQ